MRLVTATIAQIAISTGSVRRKSQPSRSSVRYAVARVAGRRPRARGTGRPSPVVASPKTTNETRNERHRRRARWPRRPRRPATPASAAPDHRRGALDGGGQPGDPLERDAGDAGDLGRHRGLARVTRAAQRAGHARPARGARGRTAGRGGAAAGSRRRRAAEPRSQARVTRRGPTRSSSGPPSALKTTSGVISTAATRPVWVAEPVVDSTNHGIAIIETRVPTKEIPRRPGRRPGGRAPGSGVFIGSVPQGPGPREGVEVDRRRARRRPSSDSSASSIVRASARTRASAWRGRQPDLPVAERADRPPLLGQEGHLGDRGAHPVAVQQATVVR